MNVSTKSQDSKFKLPELQKYGDLFAQKPSASAFRGTFSMAAVGGSPDPSCGGFAIIPYLLPHGANWRELQILHPDSQRQKTKVGAYVK